MLDFGPSLQQNRLRSVDYIQTSQIGYRRCEEETEFGDLFTVAANSSVNLILVTSCQTVSVFHTNVRTQLITTVVPWEYPVGQVGYY